jgi:hypothetical protein
MVFLPPGLATSSTLNEVFECSNVAVGGHSASTVLIADIKTAFPDLSILVPIEPGMVVLKGAVLLGFEPELVTSRISRFTYGISIRRSFKEGVDPEYKKRELTLNDPLLPITSSHQTVLSC